MKPQINKTTKIAYQGKNQAILMSVKDKESYNSNEWLTFLQAKSIDKKLVGAKGKGVHLRTFASDSEYNDRKGESEIVSRPISFCVFNSDLLEDK